MPSTSCGKISFLPCFWSSVEARHREHPREDRQQDLFPLSCLLTASSPVSGHLDDVLLMLFLSRLMRKLKIVIIVTSGPCLCIRLVYTREASVGWMKEESKVGCHAERRITVDFFKLCSPARRLAVGKETIVCRSLKKSPQGPVPAPRALR